MIRNALSVALHIAVHTFLASASASAAIAGVSIPGAYTDGSNLRQMDETSLRYYTMGAVEGLMLAPVFGGDEVLTKKLSNCIANTRSSQLSAALRIYLDANPDQWDTHGNILVYRMLLDFCKKRSKPLFAP